ncbi:unnamed protein product [Amaranthus hypochondriacus]
MISTQLNIVSCPKGGLISIHNIRRLHSLPLFPATTVFCPPLKCPGPMKVTSNTFKWKQSLPVCSSGGQARAGNGNQEPLWKSFGKAFENFGKKSSVEDVLKRQIEKREYYDEGGIPPGGKGGGGSGGSGGFGGLGGSEEEGFSGVLDETIQVVMATLGFIFLYFYIINGAEMTLLAKDFIKYIFGGKPSIRLSRVLKDWERIFKSFREKEMVDRYWLERAIIFTPTWWDHPEKYKRILIDSMQSTSEQSTSGQSTSKQSTSRQSADPEYDESGYDLGYMSEEEY